MEYNVGQYFRRRYVEDMGFIKSDYDFKKVNHSAAAREGQPSSPFYRLDLRAHNRRRSNAHERPESIGRMVPADRICLQPQ